jgi:hypothetical protein
LRHIDVTEVRRARTPSRSTPRSGGATGCAGPTRLPPAARARGPAGVRAAVGARAARAARCVALTGASPTQRPRRAVLVRGTGDDAHSTGRRRTAAGARGVRAHAGSGATDTRTGAIILARLRAHAAQTAPLRAVVVRRTGVEPLRFRRPGRRSRAGSRQGNADQCTHHCPHSHGVGVRPEAGFGSSGCGKSTKGAGGHGPGQRPALYSGPP